ncbi:hypothetical protein AB0H36_27515 [Kribbella sp. NPDC050820]|uniref:hypothetical protein n=1 Tax=Kribbella sp. NPDC050820 TaxID=3155408 RepID=UPI0033F50549
MSSRRVPARERGMLARAIAAAKAAAGDAGTARDVDQGSRMSGEKPGGARPGSRAESRPTAGA